MTRSYSIILLCIILVGTSDLYSKEYYVAPNGDDSGSGSLEQPFKTIQHAVKQLKAGDTCYLRGGRYHEAVHISNLKGLENKQITILPFNNEHVILDGTKEIKSVWNSHKGHIVKTRLNDEIWQLFVGNESMISARWPNAQWKDGAMFDQEKTWAHQSDQSQYGKMVNDHDFRDLAQADVDFTNALVMLNIGAWNTFATRVTSHKKGSNTFTYEKNLWDRLAQDVYWEMRKETGWYFFEGSLNMLDTATEWVYQADSKELYIWPSDNESPENLDIRGKTLTYALHFENSEYLKISGLHFFGSTFHIESANHVSIEDCDFKYPSYSKRMLGVTEEPEVTTIDGIENTLRNCTFAYTDGTGLKIRGERNLIENCYFHEINYSCVGDAVTVDGGEGVETIFRRNTIHTGGASVGYRSGPANLIEYNNIFDIGYLQSDGALIQVSGSAQPGTVIRYNWLHESAQASRFDDDPKYGVRFDGSFIGYLAGARDFPHGGTIHHNVVWDTRSMYVKGDSQLVYHNLSFDNLRNDIAIRSAVGNPVPKDPLKGFNYQGWGPGIDHPGENDNSITRNNLAGQISSNLRSPSNGLPGKHSNNWTGDVRSQLRDPDNLDFRLSTESRLNDAGYYIDGITGKTGNVLPDIGPYETNNGHYWIPGRQSQQASNPIPPNVAISIDIDADLMWLEGYKADSHEVYFGNSYKAVNEASPVSNEYQGVLDSNILEMDQLNFCETYFWRVDVIQGTKKIKGKIWRFTVEE
ncbi:MAG: right-handed parallel beta-helix repeat-containing protein [Bacteroidales bacterium]